MRKKLLALLLAAGLALSLLAGCGSGKSVAQALLKLLEGRYQNVSVEMDPELEADLRQVLSENENDDLAAIRAALEKVLGSTITFRKLGEGQQGDTAFDLVFYAGTDIDKASQAAYSQWNGTFSTLPDDGKYGTGLAMVETENGCFALVKATVDKAGTVDKPEPEPEPEPTIVKGNGFSYDVNGKAVTVDGAEGLQELFTGGNSDQALLEARRTSFANITITLKAGDPYTVDTTEPLADAFNGILQGEDGAKIILSGASRTQGLFNTNNGTVQDVDIEVDTISEESGTIGAVAGTNNKTISDCTVTINSTISGNGYIGAVAGTNYGTIENCDVTGGMIESTDWGDVGGIVGANGAVSTSGKTSGSIIGCSAEVTVKNGTHAGGVVGKNYSGSITACFSTGAVTSDDYAGGVVGVNYGTVTACYHADGVVSGTRHGGVAGSAYSNSVNTCYWSGSPNAGIGSGNQASDPAYSTSEHKNMVGSSDNPDLDWNAAMDAMNTELEKEGSQWRYELTDGSTLPSLTKTNS